MVCITTLDFDFHSVYHSIDYFIDCSNWHNFFNNINITGIKLKFQFCGAEKSVSQMQFDIFPVALRISVAWIACVQFVIDCCLYTLNTFDSMPVEMHQYIRIISSVCVSVFHVDGVHGVALVLNHFSRKFCMQNCVHVFFFFLYCLDSTSRTNNIEHEKSGCFTNSFFCSIHKYGKSLPLFALASPSNANPTRKRLGLIFFFSFSYFLLQNSMQWWEWDKVWYSKFITNLFCN